MQGWVVWLIVAAVLGVAELMTTTFALGIIAVGALVAACAGALGLGLPFQLLAFVVASGAGLRDDADRAQHRHQDDEGDHRGDDGIREGHGYSRG